MEKRIVVLAFVLAILVIVVAGWGAVAPSLHSLARQIFEAGPNGIDLRPTPGVISAELALPLRVDRYERGACRSIADFHGFVLGPDSVEATYTSSSSAPSSDDRVRVIAARMATGDDATTAVTNLAQRLKAEGIEASGRWKANGPYQGRRSFVSWRAATWSEDQSGFAYQSGEWVFIMTSATDAFTSQVAKEFPY